MTTPEWLGWHFLSADRKITAYNSTTPHSGVLVVPGQTLALTGRPIPCVWGLHASKRPIDALQYAPGPIVQYVRLSGSIVERADKACATERTCLWVMDASLALHICAVNFAQIALDAQLADGKKIDPRSQAALDVKLRWLKGQASDSEMAAVQAAARAAAEAWGAGYAEEAAAQAAAAALEAASAATAAAKAAAWAPSWVASRAAVWDLQNQILEVALLTQHETGRGVFVN